MRPETEPPCESIDCRQVMGMLESKKRDVLHNMQMVMEEKKMTTSGTRLLEFLTEPMCVFHRIPLEMRRELNDLVVELVKEKNDEWREDNGSTFP